jgi:CHASE2 domain-containing sensor protein
MENRIGRDTPPPITHPEHFYGFVGVALAWQIAFLIISRDPGRYRPIMIAAVFEKFSFGISTLILVAGGRVLPVVGFFAGIDLCLGVLFAISYARLR